ncbi:MAG: HD-GYP domain-containing protein [Gammaproteobacteria bacterium]
MQRLSHNDLQPGVAVAWDIYDERGTLIVRRGAVIARADLCERLLERGAFRAAPVVESPAVTAAATSPFVEADAVRGTLASLLRAIHDGAAGPAPDALLTLVDRVLELSWKNADATLGSLLLDAEAPYTEVHPLMVAVVTDLVARRQGLDAPTRRATCAAALSCNVAMLELQESLSQQAAPLSPAQSAAVRGHPREAVRLLTALGVDDPTWLAIVGDHHERADGSGYPAGKQGEAISAPTRIVALADRYAAMVLPRGYRDGLHVQRAMREIFLARGAEVDAALAQAFIKELGIYPPGIFVTTRNGDHAIVIKRGHQQATSPIVSCYANAARQAYRRPLIRDTGAASIYAIAGIEARAETGFTLPELWGHMH